jgi:hypothetical protein
MRPAFAQLKSLFFLAARFSFDEQTAVFAVNVTFPFELLAA